ncbi:hypothetical protein HDV02_002575 [Globomyces sp. JEL0801]|nr:hypothetical protein HDV02_002575 [Globomyces sp. JEL0801]
MMAPPIHRSRRKLGAKPDPNPSLLAAGTYCKLDKKISAKACFDWDYNKPYTHRTLTESLNHNKLKPIEELELSSINQLTHGILIKTNGSAADEHDKIREQHYHRREHQALGKSSGSDVVLPTFTKETNFRFGKVTLFGKNSVFKQLDESVGKIMYPKKPMPEDPKIIRQYVLSHGSFKPGEQKHHYGVDWKPKEYRETVEKRRLFNDGERVKKAIYWTEHRGPAIEQPIIDAKLSEFHDRHQNEIGHVFDPLKKTRAHLPSDFTFGIKLETPDINVADLIGNVHHTVPKIIKKDKTVLPPAGYPSRLLDDLDLQKHIVPVLGPLEDPTIVKKITEDRIGGTVSNGSPKLKSFPYDHVFGVPTVRDPSLRIGKGLKRLADKTNYGDQLGAKGLIYPIPRNVYGQAQLQSLLSKMAPV